MVGPGEPVIPRCIHRIWIGGAEPEWMGGFAETWERPGWKLRQWGEDEIAELQPLRNQSIYDRAKRLCPDHFGQLRADILRYEILERFGGVYVDADFECLRPLDDLLSGVDCFAAWEIQGKWINNAVMGAVPSHPFIERLIQGLPASVRRNRGARPNRVSGPQYVTRAWQRSGERITIFDRDLFYPYGYREISTHEPGEDWPRAYAVHHWANQRRERGVPVA